MEFLRAIGPVFNFLLLAGALFFLTRKRIRKRSGGVHPVGAALAHAFADDGAAIQKCARAEDDSPDRVNAACLGHNGGHVAVGDA